MRTARRYSAKAAGQGFSILELLIAIIIIGILVSILIPIVATRTEKAREARALSDLENLASALERVAIDTGYYTRLFMLNDTIGGDGQAFTRNPLNPNEVIDGVRDYGSGGWHGNQSQLFIDPETGLLLSTAASSALIDRLQENETSFGWYGPYINWQKDSNLYIPTDSANGAQPDGIPDDPWGNNYLFFTRAGLVAEPVGDVRTTTDFPQVGTALLTGVDCEVFDRATVVCLGRNGLPGDGTVATAKFGTDDDLVRSFGR